MRIQYSYIYASLTPLVPLCIGSAIRLLFCLLLCLATSYQSLFEFREGFQLITKQEALDLLRKVLTLSEWISFEANLTSLFVLTSGHRLGRRAVSLAAHTHQVATPTARRSGERDTAARRLATRALPVAGQRRHQALRTAGLQLDSQRRALPVGRSDCDVGGPLSRWQHTEDQQHTEVGGVRVPRLEQRASSLA